MIKPISAAFTAARSLLKSLKNDDSQTQFYETQCDRVRSLMNECSTAWLLAEVDALDYDIIYEYYEACEGGQP